MSERKRASIVIPTFNKRYRLELMLESLKYQTAKLCDYEVIIVDDGSQDGTCELVRGYKQQYRIEYIYQDNAGRSHARNTGIRAAESEMIIFCDDDVILDREFVSAHIESHSADSNSIVHGIIYSLPYLKFFKNPMTGELYEDMGNYNSNLECLTSYLITKEDLDNKERIERQKKRSLMEKIIQSVFREKAGQFHWLAFTGGNVSCKKSLLYEVGMFDETLDGRWGCEDIELGYRLFMHGGSFKYCEKACNYHMNHVRTTFREDLSESIEKFYQKHGELSIKYLPKLLLGEISSINEFIRYVEEHKLN